MPKTTIELSSPDGDYHARVDPNGARLMRLHHRGEPLIEDTTTSAAAVEVLEASSILAPWPNRLDGGRFSWQGRDVQVPVNEPDRGNAIHGLIRRRPFTVTSHSAHEVELACEIDANEWPGQLTVTVGFRLTDAGLEMSITATTDDDAAVPFAWGWHPYLRAGNAALDECTLKLPAAYQLDLDGERLLPTGTTSHPGEPGWSMPVAEDAAADAAARADAAAVPLEGVWLDNLFRLADAGDRTIYLRGPSGSGVAMEAGPGVAWVQLFTALDYPGRGRAIAIEPMSAPANALASGVDVAPVTRDRPYAASVRVFAFKTS